MIHSATQRAMPGASLIQIAAADHKPLDFRRLSQQREAVGRQREETVDGMPDADARVAKDIRHQLQGVLERLIEVLFGEGQLGG